MTLTASRSLALCERAVHCAALPALRAAQVGAPIASTDILVHDFRPDVDASCAWLDALACSGSTPFVIALLDAPASPALHALLRPQRRFRCGDVALLAECTPLRLAQTFIAAAAHVRQRNAVGVFESVWSLDPILTMAAQTALQLAHGPGRHPADTATWPSEAQLLQVARIGRGTFVRHAHKAGFRPALRFLQVFRLLSVAQSLYTGRETIAQVATDFGYASTATLRRHFRALTGYAPHEGRHIAPTELARIIQRRLAGAHVPAA